MTILFSVANWAWELYISTRTNGSIVVYLAFYPLEFFIEGDKFCDNYLFRVIFIYCQIATNFKNAVVKNNVDISNILPIGVDAFFYNIIIRI